MNELDPVLNRRGRLHLVCRDHITVPALTLSQHAPSRVSLVTTSHSECKQQLTPPSPPLLLHASTLLVPSSLWAELGSHVITWTF